MKDLEQKIVYLISEAANCAAIYLFGSHAKGKTTKRSDVDVAILCDSKNIPDEMKRVSIQQDLSDELGKDCDLIILNDASSILCMQVLKNGKPLAVKNRKLLDEFIITNISKYFDLKTIRATIEENILRGKTYGR